MGKKPFSHLSAPPVPPFFPCLTFPSSSSSSPPSFFAFICSFLLFLLCAALRASPKCSYGVSTKGSDFSHSRREQGARLLLLPPVGMFQKLLSHPAISLHHTPPSNFSIQPPHPPPSSHPFPLYRHRCHRGRVRTGRRRSMGRRYFLAEGLQRWQRAALMCVVFLCNKARHHTRAKNLDICGLMVA